MRNNQVFVIFTCFDHCFRNYDSLAIICMAIKQSFKFCLANVYAELNDYKLVCIMRSVRNASLIFSRSDIITSVAGTFVVGSDCLSALLNQLLYWSNPSDPIHAHTRKINAIYVRYLKLEYLR